MDRNESDTMVSDDFGEAATPPKRHAGPLAIHDQRMVGSAVSGDQKDMGVTLRS